jgi:hypothetical protein
LNTIFAAAPEVPVAFATTVPTLELAACVTLVESIVADKVMLVSVAGLVVPVRIPVTMKESAAVTLDQFAVIKTVAVSPAEMAASPTVVDPVPAAIVIVDVTTAPEAEPEAITPRLKEATTASAMRLKVVLLDIYFLSIVVTETFPVAALRWVARADTSPSPPRFR